MRQRLVNRTKMTGLLAAAALALAACGAGPGGGGDGAEPEEGGALSQEEAVEEIDAIVEQMEGGELEYDVSADSDPTIEALRELIQKPDGYPARPVEVIIGFGEGGGSDNYARNIAIDAQRIMGQEIILNNIPGASGEVALGQMFSGPTDGYVISTVITNQVINDAIGSQPYSFVDEVSFIIRQQGPTEVYWVTADSPFTDFQSMLDFAVENPGQVTVSGSGRGGDDEVRLLALGEELGTSFNFVPYDGVGGRTTALLGGDIDVLHETAGTVIDLYNDGQIRPLAYGGDIVFERIDPEIPSVAELGYPVPTGRWRGIVAPQEVDPAIIDYLHHVFYAASQLPSYTEYEEEFFQDVAGGYLNSEEFEEAARAEKEELLPLVEDLDV
ncbi:MAG TPA: tripartite tricarboxylate transporter substrate-binding protein [Actinomycetales bacterium]|nr:tripartite tricarboxylate transporter substrate-binding protein [Actinomycetales bacterium]